MSELNEKIFDQAEACGDEALKLMEKLLIKDFPTRWPLPLTLALAHMLQWVLEKTEGHDDGLIHIFNVRFTTQDLPWRLMRICGGSCLKEREDGRVMLADAHDIISSLHHKYADDLGAVMLAVAFMPIILLKCLNGHDEERFARNFNRAVATNAIPWRLVRPS